jgi:glycosyltransferase involved in cell wall biosynthesis
MRVLHVIPSVAERSGGPATAIIPMCRALIDQGVEVLLVTTDAGLSDDQLDRNSGGKPPFQTCSFSGALQNSEKLPDFEQLEKEQVRKGGLPPLLRDYKGVPAMFFPSQLGESFKYSRPLASWLRSNIQHFGLAHIHAVFNHSSVAAAHACRKAGVPYVVRPLGTLDPWSMTQKSLRKRLFWQVSGKGMLRRASAVHYTSEVEKRATEELFDLNHGKVIALGIDGEVSNAFGKDRLNEYFPLLARDPYLLVMSRLHPKKGLDVLLDAFLSLVQDKRWERWRLVIAGDGTADYVLKLKNKVKSQRERILLTGWLEGEKKAAVLSGAALLVLPSYQENFGLCVMEALSNSVPVLVSPHVNLAEEIVSANAGWVAEVDKDQLEARLAQVLGDHEELKRRGRAGKELSERYSWEAAGKGLKELYEDISRKGAKVQREALRFP